MFTFTFMVPVRLLWMLFVMNNELSSQAIIGIKTNKVVFSRPY